MDWSYGAQGLAIVVFYFVVFLVIATFRRKIAWREAGRWVRIPRLAPQLFGALRIPLLFVGLGLLPMISNLECVGERPHYCDESEVYPCVEPGTCEDIVAMDGPRNINWTMTILNAYGIGVVSFQFLVAIVCIALSIVACFWGFWWTICRAISNRKRN